MSITWIVGNILDAKADAILHQTNCKGVMGAGLALQIRNKYPDVYAKYRILCKEEGTNLLGCIEVESPNAGGPKIVNIFAQDDYNSTHRCTSYDALEQALSKAADIFSGRTVAVPYKMSCGLAGGNWEIVKVIIQETIGKVCEVQIYRLPGVPLDTTDYGLPTC